MLTTTRRGRKRRREVLQEVGRQRVQEDVACAAGVEEWQIEEWSCPPDLGGVVEEAPPAVVAWPEPRLVSLDGRPLCADQGQKKSRLVGLDGQPLDADQGQGREKFREENFREEEAELVGFELGELGELGEPGEPNELLEGDRQTEEGDCCTAPRGPSLEVADVFRRFGMDFRSQYGQYGETLTVQQDRVLRELMVCRTEVMGWHRWACDRCGVQVELYNSCNNRHCPKCHRKQRKKWAAKIQADLLPIEGAVSLQGLP